ncbi:MAG: TetR/AcrR family transcriptional regulator [Cytophagaceae bacterium]|nr:TetR/AcrR family transcriptional regulator [Cytophagaceae bacterium]
MEQEIETGERILMEAEQLFFRYGVKSITMDEIAMHLGISKKTIYQFYKDKKELVYKVVETRMMKQQCEIAEIAEKAADPVQEILMTSDWLKNVFQNMNPFLLMEVQKYYPRAFSVFQAHRDKCIFVNIYNNIKRGIDSGLYRNSIDVDTIARLRMVCVDATLNPENFPLAKKNLNELQLQLIEHFLYGICTLKGHKLINKYKQIKEEE